jgi:Tfp pilus assembly protein PilZ
LNVKKPKAVFKRPWLHHVIIIVYIAAPIVNILLLRLFLNVSFGVIFSQLFAGYGILATVWLVTAPIVGISLYFVNRLSWYVFLVHSGLILLDFIYKWATRPAYYLRTVPGFHNILILAGNLALVALVAYIIQKDFRSPYIQVLNRNWRERKRIPIYHMISLDGAPREVSDLSTGGCFVVEKGTSRAMGSRVELSFSSDILQIECTGEVMRGTGEGYGIRFMSLAAAKRRDIARMLRKRFSLRHKVELPCTLVVAQQEREAMMLDLSSSGCYVQAGTAGLQQGSAGALRVRLPDDARTFLFPGKAVWINSTGEDEKPVGLGFQFDRRQGRFLKVAALRHGKGVLIR